MHPLMLLETAYFFGSHGDAARCSLKYDVYVMYLLRSSFVPEMWVNIPKGCQICKQYSSVKHGRSRKEKYEYDVYVMYYTWGRRHLFPRCD
jgi:hypothetical protein